MYRVDRLPLREHLGNTPLFAIPSRPGRAKILLKMEGQNAGGSVKDRAAWGMLRYAEAEGLLTEGTTLVEPTSGNTGIALAMLGRALGLRVLLTMPESMSRERRSVLAAYGAELVLTPAVEGMKGAISRAREIVAEVPGAYMPDQFSNPGNPWAHQVTTGPEILRDLKGVTPAAFVAGIGTGGTISGTGRALRGVFPGVQIVGAEPAASPVLSGGKPGPHKIQGIGAGFVPENLDASLLNRVMTVEEEAAFETTRWLARSHGIFAGISAGANVWAALQIAGSFPGDQVVVTVVCDRGDKYISTGVFDA